MPRSAPLTDKYGDSVEFVSYAHDPSTIDVGVSHGGKGFAIIKLDPNELRDAIDKAVGKRETPTDDSVDQRLRSWDEIADHEFFESCFRTDGALIGAMLKKLDSIQTHQGYPAKQRTAHLNHIADVEASLTRRNEQRLVHEARIRELEVEVGRAENAKNEAEVREAQLLALTPREHLELAWETATVPEGDTIPTGTPSITRFAHGSEVNFGANPDGYDMDLPTRGGISIKYERRLLDPRVEPTAAEKRQALIDEHGLADWELELLMGSES